MTQHELGANIKAHTERIMPIINSAERAYDIARIVTCSVDLADIIRSYHIELIDKGGIWRGRCPFCNQGNDFPLRIKKASGGPGDQIWKCHQCRAAGNILTFIERFENINRMEALVKLFKLAINPKPKAPKGETK